MPAHADEGGAHYRIREEDLEPARRPREQPAKAPRPPPALPEPARPEPPAPEALAPEPTPEASPVAPMPPERRETIRLPDVELPGRDDVRPPEPRPRAVALTRVEPRRMCVTSGSLAGARIDAPTFRAVAPGHGGDGASLRFRVHGTSDKTRALASGQQRRQVGLKLRAADACNLVYVMWRLDPKPTLEVSVKRNAGARSSNLCGAGGYTKLRPARIAALPALDDGGEHELRAEILGDELTAWVDGRIAWEGTLPRKARDLDGPAGVRSDNLVVEIEELSVDDRSLPEDPMHCASGHGDEVRRAEPGAAAGDRTERARDRRPSKGSRVSKDRSR